MRVGIVAEGPADIAILRNILKGKLGLHAADTEPLRPKLARDETDLAAEQAANGYRAPTAESYSNWAIVLDECRRRTTIEDFLTNQLDEKRLVVIHIDTAEAHLPGYDITRPNDRKSDDYIDQLRALVVMKLEALLGPELSTHTRYAIAIEETEAWLLTIYDPQGDGDTSRRLDPKKRLRYLLEQASNKAERNEKKKTNQKGDQAAKKSHKEKRSQKFSEYELARMQSLDFCEQENLLACACQNRSLQLFLDSL